MGKTESINERINKKLKVIKKKEEGINKISEKENEEIKKRGLYVKKRERKYFPLSIIVFLLSGYLISIFIGNYLWLFILLLTKIYDESFLTLIVYYFMIHLVYMGMYIRLLIASIYGNDEFYSSKEKPINSFFNKWHTIKWSLIDISDNFNESILKFILIILFLSLPYGLGTTIIYQQYGLGGLYPYFFILAGSISAFFIFSFLGRTVLEHYSPIYSFAHVGKKIQLLTSEIEKKSQAIGENFKKDMNFRVFSDGFDMLAETFSEIISLVIKLEKIEQKANKGNLFDSQKYIGSLRSDIVEPLQSLKLFLGNQREKLISSQKELQEVRIGGINSTDSSLHSGGQEQASGGQEHAELSSKRGEFLIHELDESTEKLNTMIAKMTH